MPRFSVWQRGSPECATHAAPCSSSTTGLTWRPRPAPTASASARTTGRRPGGCGAPSPAGRRLWLGQRSRKRGRRQKPAVAVAAGARPSRSEQKDAAVRATLTPLRPGERPWPITVGALVAALWGTVNLALFIAGVKLKSSGLHASLGQTLIFTILMT